MVSTAVELQLPAMQPCVPASQTGPMESGVRALRCVIVDDNPGFLDAAANFLSRHSITVVGVARTIAEALSCIAELRPDVTVVDINLGSESGFDLADRLAGASVSSPVILTSTHSEQEFAEMITASSALGFVPKAELSPAAIRGLLDKSVH
jgi:DNA-binding NarL/FixJ family response regulator